MLLHCWILAFAFAAIGDCGGRKRYEGWSLIKAKCQNENQLAYLNSLSRNESRSQFEIWSRGSLTRPFDIFISPEAKGPMLDEFRKLGITYEIKADNVQRALDAERNTAPMERSSANINNAEWFHKFLTLDEMEAAVQKLIMDYPDIVSKENIGTTHEGRPITVVKVSSTNSNGSKPGIWIDGGIHAREWISPAVVLFMLNKLVTTYHSNNEIRKFIDNATFYVVLVLNPDGYNFTFELDRMWRKNRRDGPCGAKDCCPGVDLNRNFDHDFESDGSSPEPCMEDYRGPSAFSEPETQAVRDFFLSHTNMSAYISLHAYGQYWFYPYCSRRDYYPPDVKELKSTAKRAAQALSSLHGTKYQVGTAPELLYPAGGSTIDWVKSKAGVKYAYGLELRPDHSSGLGFIVEPSAIVPAGEETLAGLSVVFDAAIKHGSDLG